MIYENINRRYGGRYGSAMGSGGMSYYSIETKPIWDALHDYRENNIPEGTEMYDEQWDAICYAMAICISPNFNKHSLVASLEVAEQE